MLIISSVHVCVCFRRQGWWEGTGGVGEVLAEMPCGRESRSVAIVDQGKGYWYLAF